MSMKTYWLSSVAAILLASCGGGGSSSTPSPSLSSNLPSSAFDDETVVVTVTARNFGVEATTYTATSNSLPIQQGDADNQFVITDSASVPGNHTITFSASDTSGKSATLRASIRIDVVATGIWQITSVSVDGIVDEDTRAEATVSRGGRIYLVAGTDRELDEKCFGSNATTGKILTFEIWCADTDDGYQVDEEGYRITGELEIDGEIASGEYTLYASSGGLLGVANVDMERINFYQLLYQVLGIVQEAPTSATGAYFYVGPSGGSSGEFITVDSSGNVTPYLPGGSCEIDGYVAPVDIALKEEDEYVSTGILDATPISQTGCRSNDGNFPTGNRDIAAGEGIISFIPGVAYGFQPQDEVLWIYLSDSANSYGGVASELPFLRVCSADGSVTPFGVMFGFAEICTDL